MSKKSDEKEMTEWLKRANKGSAEKIKDSDIFLSLATDNYMDSPLCALQLGLAILMDKPILVVANTDQKVPENLLRIAKVVVRGDLENSEGMSKAVKDAIKGFDETLN